MIRVDQRSKKYYYSILPYIWQRSPYSFPGWYRSRKYYFDDENKWSDEAYRRLALAIFAQAVKDTRKSGKIADEARSWLADKGLTWLQLCGLSIQPGRLKLWVSSGCPKPINENRKAKVIKDQGQIR
jgi:hypothetical protein